MNHSAISGAEEETLVYVEIGDDVEIEQFKKINVLGINTINPIVQMDDHLFMGKYESPLGTYMFFKDVPPPQKSDPVFDKIPEKNLEFLCKTGKLIKMEHAYIKPNNSDQNPGDESQACNNMIEPVDFNSFDEAQDKFKTYWQSIGSEKDMKEKIKN